MEERLFKVRLSNWKEYYAQAKTFDNAAKKAIDFYYAEKSEQAPENVISFNSSNNEKPVFVQTVEYLGDQVMTEKEFNAYLKSIGGLESGWGAMPNKYNNPWQYKAFVIAKMLGYSDEKNPFRAKIMTSAYFEFRSGWYQLTKNMIDELIKAGWNKQLAQAKEKFGGLRFYIGGGSNDVYNIISKYEEISIQTCEVCGQPGKIRSGRWIQTLCDEHNKLKE